MTEERKPKSKISVWKPTNDKEILVNFDGKIFIVYFEKILKPENKVRIYDIFYIKKSSYGNQLNIITKYINFFLNFYDTDHEVLMAYLKLKYALDKEKKFNDKNVEQLIDLIYELMFTENVIDNICKLVDANYLDDIESQENTDKYVKKEKKYLESLEFTNMHIKILLRISFGMKIMMPVVSHFIYTNNIKLDKDSEGDFIYKFYKKLFDIFSEKEGINIYNKLFVYVKAKVLEFKAHNSVILNQRLIMGVDEYSVINKFIRKVLIAENIIKYKFSEIWDPKTKKYKENITGFNKTIIKYQLSFFLKEQYKKTLTEVTFSKNADELSGMDKMEMNLQKMDEGALVLSRMNVRFEMEKIKKDYGFDISDDEINYYIKYHRPSLIQAELVYSYWSKRFGSQRHTNLIKRRDYVILLLILKKQLLFQAGYENEDDIKGTTKYAALSYLLSGNLKDRVTTRIIRNNKFIDKIVRSELYQKLSEYKYNNLLAIDPDYILSLLSKLINTNFTYVVYNHPELLDKDIEYNEDIISDESLFFLDSI